MSIFYRYDKPVTPITTAGIYHSPSLGLISLSSDGTNWITIADKNLGATQVYNDGDTLSEANCGKFFQWGNNYGFPFTGTVTTSSSQVNAGTYGPGNYYSSSTFITTTPRDSSVNVNLWGATTGTNEAMRGPCDIGYHVPINTEWQTIYNLLVTSFGLPANGNTIGNYLKMSYAGYRDYSSSGTYLQSTRGYYWSTFSNNSSAYCFLFTSSQIAWNNGNYHSNGLSIRPFANTPVQPDDSWTVLYQPS